MLLFSKNGIFKSFTDAPGGISEELSEITAAIGLEYCFQDSLSLRTGFFNESQNKGSRRYLTMGAGFNLNLFEIDLSYLFSTSRVSHFWNRIWRKWRPLHFGGMSPKSAGYFLLTIFTYLF